MGLVEYFYLFLYPNMWWYNWKNVSQEQLIQLYAFWSLDVDYWMLSRCLNQFIFPCTHWWALNNILKSIFHILERVFFNNHYSNNGYCIFNIFQRTFIFSYFLFVHLPNSSLHSPMFYNYFKGMCVCVCKPQH